MRTLEFPGIIIYNRVAAAFPLCVPARMSMFTGHMPHELGIFANMLRKFQRENPRIGCALNWDEEEVRRYRWGYNRLVEAVDSEIGRVLDALERSQLREETLIIFPSDHGDGQGAHRWNQKWSLYDNSSRAPLIISAPGGDGKGAVETTPVSAGLDLFPTICDYAGITPPGSLHGQSLRPLVEKSASGQRAFVASETSLGNWGELHEDRWPKGRMIRTERYKYIAYDTGKRCEQLFDVKNDPCEIDDLAPVPEYDETLNRHRDHLRNWCKQTTCFQGLTP